MIGNQNKTSVEVKHTKRQNMIGSKKKTIKRTVSFTDDSIVQSTPKRPRSIFKAKRRSAVLERNASISSITSELSDISPLDTSITSTSSTISKRRKSIGEKITATKKKIMSRIDSKSKTKKTEHPNRVFSTKLILAENQNLVDDLVIWEETYTA